MDLLDRMLGYDRWANEQLLELSGTLTDDQLDREFDIGHRSIRATLGHMVYVIDLWTGWMSGRPVPHDWKPEPHERTIASMNERHSRFHADFSQFARQSNDEGRLDEIFRDHFDFPQSIGATILQVLNHNAQHRSEVRHMLERLGVADMYDFDPQEWEHLTGRI